MKRVLLSKQILLILLYILLPICFISAADYVFDPTRFFLAPYATSNIDLRKWKYYSSRDKYSVITGSGTDTSNSDYLTWTDSQGMVGEYTERADRYTDKNMVMLGGYSGKKGSTNIADLKNKLTGGTVNISVSTDSGAMELVSQSNSAYRWPFEFWLVVKTSNSEAAGDNKTVSIFKVDDPNMTFKSDPIAFNAGDDASTNGCVVFFDMIIAFPIDENSFNESNMTFKSLKGRTYYVAEKDDYGAMVTVTMTLQDKDGIPLGSGISLTVPFSGFYLKNSSATPTESLASLSVLLNAAASTLDLATENNRYIKIGDVDLMANYFKTGATAPNHVHLFLSSSPNPNISGENFKFIKVGETIPTVANSLPFRLILVGEDGYYEDDTSISQQRVDFDGTLKSPASSVITEEEHKKYVTAEKFVPNVYSAPGNQGKITYFQYSGDLYIETDKVVTGQLVSGVYQEDVYVHVFSD